MKIKFGNVRKMEVLQIRRYTAGERIEKTKKVYFQIIHFKKWFSEKYFSHMTGIFLQMFRNVSYEATNNKKTRSFTYNKLSFYKVSL